VAQPLGGVAAREHRCDVLHFRRLLARVAERQIILVYRIFQAPVGVLHQLSVYERVPLRLRR
jgi:hypothetical protein